jgi:hypothetical protein
MGQAHLGSDSKKPQRPKHRFSFSGQSEQPEVTRTPRPANVTKGDILNSLTKHAHPQEPQETIPETESVFQSQEPDPTTLETRARNRGSARGALVIFLGGFLAVWLYGYVTGAYEIPYLRGVTQNSAVQIGVQFASSNPILSSAVAASVLLGILYLWHRNRS